MLALALAATLAASLAPTFGVDKLQHAAGSAVLTGGFYWAMRYAGASKEAATLGAVLFTVGVGLTRELSGNNDAADLGAGMVGMIPVLALSIHFDPGCVEVFGIRACPE